MTKILNRQLAILHCLHIQLFVYIPTLNLSVLRTIFAKCFNYQGWPYCFWNYLGYARKIDVTRYNMF